MEKDSKKEKRKSKTDRRQGERRWLGNVFPQKINHERRKGERRLENRREK